ncbi:GNAT family N-acetyltransferase [Luteococcus sp. OSA5]|uniref:GNAT family N-acetyltransferase n=1 Tax=Luteococcus sp. OSA5 TaxID=3401630 RepID=UPI003B42DC35
MAIESHTLRLPATYNPAKHTRAVLNAAVQKKLGTDWQVETVDPEAGTKLSDGDRIAARQAELNPGWFLVKFNPHVGTAMLAKLNEAEFRCREAVAQAMRCKPWDVQVQQRPDGGFNLQLPGTYTPSQHDAKLQEVAEGIVGKFGWYIEVNPQTLVAQIIPSDPPTFPKMVKLPISKLGKGSMMKTPFGVKLPEVGQAGKFETVYVDWKASAWALLGGMPGAGKSVLLFALISDLLSNGSELVIIDDPEKSADFDDFKKFVRPGGWGCTGLRSSITALALVNEELNRRAEWMRERGFKNWLDIPDKDRFQPITIVVDEIEALLVTEKLPRSRSTTSAVCTGRWAASVRTARWSMQPVCLSGPCRGRVDGMTVRRAVAEDVIEIIELIQALADYEKEPDAVRNTPEKLHALLFAEHPAIFCHVVDAPPGSGHRIDGFALWFLNYSTWEGTHGIYLEDYFVRPEARGKGLGSQLLASLAAVAAEHGYARMEWVVLKWNQSAIDVYQHMGAVALDEWDTYRLTGEALTELAGRGQLPT